MSTGNDQAYHLFVTIHMDFILGCNHKVACTCMVHVRTSWSPPGGQEGM